ncbi:LysR family transcriptional regulator [Vreelandella titanicae]|mgnify:CR=1 FL=1|jgi:molybdate transport repressor ModE-like protein|uniref:LysR family transcriptional regulator n=1 Tax=Halomonadaceae TaxID=28256 RepID=UPI0003497374|nr:MULTISPECIES: LysR family transcriptional regulator [Halomonas]KIN16120.1 transcriptional regulator [Halomonas sp. KHS3]MCE7516769.1 LysR family transcriptional regulator [Halomonas titanicae]NVE90941.1 LysR family transcriptional regulator [Halomonas titanicae]|tara:strand:- start:184 stop:1053 length:870 start_codon:yes stop_codon:yes gene_type:complete
MDWNALKIFLAIEQAGSLAGAARALGVNHSTVFRRLNTLEKDLGSRLFERQSGGYALTPLGEELRDIANRVDGAFNDMERHIAGRDVQPKGKVRITAPNNLAYRYLPDYLADFNRSYPDIKVELLVSNLEVNMNSRQADIAVRVTDAPPEHLVGRQVRSIGWSVYGSAAYREKYGFPGDLDALQHHRLIGASGGMQHLPAFVWVERNLAQCVSARSDDLVAMSSLAQSGHGLALLPNDQQRPELEALFALPPGKTSNLWLLTHPDLRQVERIKLVMRHLADDFAGDHRL